jgi:hypothetical protein
MTISCLVCSAPFTPQDPRSKICSPTCHGIRLSERSQQKYALNPKICEFCQNPISYKSRLYRYCSKSCGAKANMKKREESGWQHSSETKKRLSEISRISGQQKSLITKKLYLQSPSICQECKVPLPYTHRRLKTCSLKCNKALSAKNISITKKGKPGCFRHRAGRGKQGYYQGFFCNSTYEIAYYIFCTEHQISITRNKAPYLYFNPITQREHNFYPDFRVNGKLIEIKGFKSPVDDFKLSGVTEPIQILYLPDLQEVFSYVENKTGLKIKDLYKLYDNGQ